MSPALRLIRSVIQSDSPRFGADRTEKFGVKEVDNNNRNKEVSGLQDIKASPLRVLRDLSHLDDIQGWTGFSFPGRKDKVCEP